MKVLINYELDEKLKRKILGYKEYKGLPVKKRISGMILI